MDIIHDKFTVSKNVQYEEVEHGVYAVCNEKNGVTLNVDKTMLYNLITLDIYNMRVAELERYIQAGIILVNGEDKSEKGKILKT